MMSVVFSARLIPKVLMQHLSAAKLQRSALFLALPLVHIATVQYDHTLLALKWLRDMDTGIVSCFHPAHASITCHFVSACY